MNKIQRKMLISLASVRLLYNKDGTKYLIFTAKEFTQSSAKRRSWLQGEFLDFISEILGLFCFPSLH